MWKRLFRQPLPLPHLSLPLPPLLLPLTETEKTTFYMGYHVDIMQCMQPNFLLTGQV